MTDKQSTPASSPEFDDSASQQADNPDDPQKKAKRRTKKDSATIRNHICGCGKQYLSYAALYTHLKTKHDGKQPPGTRALLPYRNSKRGRPKKSDLGTREQTLNAPKPEEKQESNLINSFLRPYINDSQLLAKNILDKSDLVSLRTYNLNGKCDPTSGLPCIYDCNEQEPVMHPFLSIIHVLSQIRGKNFLAPSLQTKNPSCDIMISLFLFCASKLLQDRFYVVIGILFRNLRECLNESGYDIIATFLKNHGHPEKAEAYLAQKNKEKVFSADENCDYIPVISDYFIQKYLPVHCPQFDIQLAIDCMFDFSNWLFKKLRTKIKIRFQDEGADLSNKIVALSNL